MSKVDAALLILASALISVGVFVISVPAGVITTGLLVGANVLVDR